MNMTGGAPPPALQDAYYAPMKAALFLVIATALCATAGQSAAAQGVPAAPGGLILEMNPIFAAPSPHAFNFHWLVAEDAAGYGWEVERGSPAADGSVTFKSFQLISPGNTFPGDWANVIDDQTPPGVFTCFRVRAVLAGSPPGAWSANACGDLAKPPQPIFMDVQATILADRVSLSWQSQPGADLGYWPQESLDRAGGARDWLGTFFVPQAAGRPSSSAPVSVLPNRWCFRVFPLSSAEPNVVTSEELCIDFPGYVQEGPPAGTVTPRVPAVGTGPSASGTPALSHSTQIEVLGLAAIIVGVSLNLLLCRSSD
jgi:hypothetical protein